MVDAVVDLIDIGAFVGAASDPQECSDVSEANISEDGADAMVVDDTAHAFDFVAAHLGVGRATAKPEVNLYYLLLLHILVLHSIVLLVLHETERKVNTILVGHCCQT